MESQQKAGGGLKGLLLGALKMRGQLEEATQQHQPAAVEAAGSLNSDSALSQEQQQHQEQTDGTGADAAGHCDTDAAAGDAAGHGEEDPFAARLASISQQVTHNTFRTTPA